MKVFAINSLFVFSTLISINYYATAYDPYNCLRTCDEIDEENERNNLLQRWDKHYLKHAYHLYGDNVDKEEIESEKNHKKLLLKLFHNLMKAKYPFLKFPLTISQLLSLLSQLSFTATTRFVFRRLTAPADSFQFPATNELPATEEDITSTTTATIPTTPTTKPTTTTPFICPITFIKLDKICYFFSQDKKNWDDAQKACLAMNSTLAHPSNDHQRRMVLAYVWPKFQNRTKPDYWLGGHNRFAPKKFRWIFDNSEIVCEDARSNQCFGLIAVQSLGQISYKWVGDSCKKEHNYICQVPK
ncbi:hypothetical protein CHUAL_006153 [Chamberlinius hualienensis]